MRKLLTIYAKSLLLTLLLTLTIFSIGQSYADKDFYLVDSLIIDDLDEFDKNIIDSFLHMYHNETDDTIRLGYIEQIIENSWNDKVTSRYNDYLKWLVYKEKYNIEDPSVNKKIAYFKAVAHGNTGYYFDMESQFDSAQVYYQKAYEIFKEIDHLGGMGNAIYQIALTYKVQGNSILALEKYKEAAVLCKKGNDFRGLAANYMSIGDILYDVEEYEEAETNYRKAIQNARRVDDWRRIGTVLNDLALLRLQQGQPLEAIILCDSAIAKMKAINFVAGIANVTNSLVSCYLELGDNEKALEYGIESLAISKRISNNELAHIAYNNLTKIELNRHNYSKALEYALSAEKLIEKTNSVSYEKITVKNLAQIYKKQGKYKQATSMLERKADLEYQLFNDRIRSTAIKSSFQTKFEKQKEIDDLKNAQELELADEQKRRVLLGLLAAALIALIIGIATIVIFNRLKLISKQKLALDNAYTQLEEAKKNELAVSNLKALQSQMNPHFIFNALNSVQDLVLLKDIRNSNKYLGKFSDLIRKILLSSKEQFISLEEEIEILSLYLDLEKLRFGEDFKVQLEGNVAQELQEKIKLPAMFIQPYIENAIKHGLFHKVGEKRLRVQFSIQNRPARFPKPGRSESYLECIVQDNGIGQERAAEMKIKNLHLHTGFSTEAIAERIRLLNETLDKKIDLQIEDLMKDNLSTGTKITLHFPVDLDK